MKSIRSILLIALLQVVAASPVFAANELAQIKAAGVFKVGTEGTYAPFTYHDDSGKLTGFDVEIATAITQRLGVKPEFVEGKWDGLIAGLDVNRYDAVINEVAVTDARKVKYDFSDPYIASHAALIVRSDNTTIRSFDDLKGRKTADALTSNYGKIAKDHGADLVAMQDFNDSIGLLLSGRVEATVNDSLTFLDFKKHKPDAKVKIVAIDNSGDSGESAVLLRKGNPELQAAINKALADIKADGTYEKISHKYFGKDVSR
ncbi:amino acid ABC transporter substrate-binding protein [Paraburkholderia xenovorans]|uniref:amino acid ABC transporter substrate-binding protein n=1 Tax=Paraburkholderia xenovorans TaxID=36873 RepID=UPI0038B7EFF2